MTDHDDRQLRETLDRARLILAKLTDSDLDPDHHHVLVALDALCRRDISTPITADERSLLDLAAALTVTEETAGDTVLAETSIAAARHRPETRMRAATVTCVDATENVARLNSAAFHELVRSSMAGDRRTIATLFSWIRPTIVRYCRFQIGRSGSTYSAADDVAQEVCVAALAALSRFDDKPESFLRFVYSIAARTVTDHHRQAVRHRSPPAGDLPGSVSAETSPIR